jgi:hypothetical protein
MSSWYLSRTPRVSLTTSASRERRSSSTSRPGPVDGFGDAGPLEEIGRAQFLHERNDIGRELFGEPGHLAPDDLQFGSGGRIVHPVIQAAALYCVM